CLGYIAEFGWADEISSHVQEWALNPDPGVFVRVAYVNRLAGATAGLFGIGQSARKSGIRVLQFDRSARFDPNRVLDLVGSSTPTILLIDGGYAFADDVDTLARLAHE